MGYFLATSSLCQQVSDVTVSAFCSNTCGCSAPRSHWRASPARESGHLSADPSRSAFGTSPSSSLPNTADCVSISDCRFPMCIAPEYNTSDVDSFALGKAPATHARENGAATIHTSPSVSPARMLPGGFATIESCSSFRPSGRVHATWTGFCFPK